MNFNFGPKDIISIIRRRFFWAAIPFLLIVLGAILYIKTIDPIYQSQTILIVEDQQIRDEYVASAVESQALQRVEAISARVKARDNLLTIADQLELYKDEGLSASQRFEKLQENTNIDVRLISGNRRRNEGSAITVTIAFRSASTVTAQRMTNALLTDFTSRSVELRTEIASDTSDFLRSEELKIRSALDLVSGAINDIKKENLNSLPENRPIYERQLDRATSERTRIENSTQETNQSIRLLKLQKPLLVNNNAQESPLTRELAAKRRALEQLRSEYQDNYPDVVALKQEVLSLERDIDPTSFRRHANEEVTQLTAQMSEQLRGSLLYNRFSARRDVLREQLSNLPSGTSANLSEIQYEAQLQNFIAQQKVYDTRHIELTEQITDLELQISAIPVVEGQLFRLYQERQQLQTDLSTLRTDLANAERSESLERDSKAERLTVIEQPTRPDQPISPDIPRLSILGVGAAGLIAGLIALFPEILFAKVYTRDHLHAAIPGTKIIEIPRFQPAKRSLMRYAQLMMLTLVTVSLSAAVGWAGFKTLL